MINEIMKRLSELPGVTLSDGQEYIQLYDAMETVKRALEQEPSGDAVSRQAVHKEILVLWNSGGDKDYCMESLRDFVAELSPVNPQDPKWIPVNEMLPKEGEDVLACFYTGEGNYKMMVSRRSDYNYWSGVGRTGDMVAWMPLPHPYEPQESEG